MSKNKQIKHKGFTLLEILLVTGIIGILTAIVIIAINPGRSLAKARDVQRKVGITEINKGLEQYYIDHNQYPTSINGPIGSLKSICNTGSVSNTATSTAGENCAATGLINLSELVPTYLPSIPVDPTGVGYKVGFNTSRRIMLVADLTETVSPLIAIGTTTYPVVLDTSPTIVLGTGTVGDPYQINNWSQLNHIRDNGYMNKYYILMSSLTSATYGYAGLGSAWTPIGSSGTPFTGNFNGSNNTISNLVINKPTAEYVGLFASVSGQISNLGLINVNVTGYDYVAGLVGYSDGAISNSYSTGDVNGHGAVAGLVGYSNGAISNSYSVGDVNGVFYVGGLVGYLDVGRTISNSYSTGDVNSSWGLVGGLVGYQEVSSIITYSYSTGNVNSEDSSTGGLVGYSAGTISYSYSTGGVNGTSNVGGLLGQSDDYSTISYSYSTGDVTGSFGYVGGLVGFQYDYLHAATINNSYSTGNVNGPRDVGGLVGDAYGDIFNSYSTGNVNCSGVDESVGGLVGAFTGSTISNSYSIGTVTGSGRGVGGFAGFKGSGTITSSFWDQTTSLQQTSAGGTGTTTAGMKTASLYTGWSSSIWNISDGSYPTFN